MPPSWYIALAGIGVLLVFIDLLLADFEHGDHPRHSGGLRSTWSERIHVVTTGGTNARARMRFRCRLLDWGRPVGRSIENREGKTLSWM
jgi:hypothetical protein